MKSKLPFARLALLAATILVISTLSFSQSHSPTLTPKQSGTTSRLQAISPVNSQIVWASGVLGTFAVTSDGGAHWRSGVVPGAETLQFRDVEGVTDKIAYLLAAGSGTDSRIYKRPPTPAPPGRCSSSIRTPMDFTIASPSGRRSVAW